MFTLPKLDYKYSDLAPAISADIMQLHHSKHHQTYVDKLNAALEKVPEVQGKTIEEILQDLDSLPDEIRTVVRNNGGGHYNHSLFWQVMTPGGSEMTSELSGRINQAYGDFDTFKNNFTQAALGVFGSGWVWLLPDLSIEVSPLQDSPIMRGVSPILGLDVWEHAYYLDYQNRRPEYVAAWWGIVDWNEVSCRLTG
ncbi:MAG: superoxide dismutase [Patescibacteria group bacterium]